MATSIRPPISATGRSADFQGKVDLGDGWISSKGVRDGVVVVLAQWGLDCIDTNNEDSAARIECK